MRRSKAGDVVFDTIVRGGNVVLPEREAPLEADIAIADGRVVALLERGAPGAAAKTFNVAGKSVLPGAIDPHVHVSWPYLDSRTADDYATATRAAARGGTTSIIDFAIEERDSPVAAVERRQAEAAGEAVVDYSFHCVVSDATERVLDELAEVVARGVTSFKLYMTYRRRGLMVDDATLFAVAERAGELGAAVGVHAENGVLEEARLARMRADGRGASRFFPELKPPFVEAEAIARASRITAAAGGRLWILHLSSEAGLRAALGTRAETGQPAALETCPHYLLLTEDALFRSDGHRFLCSPPLRRDEDGAALWAGLADGTVDWIGTDHALFLSHQKDERADTFWDCPHGFPGVQTRPALVLENAGQHGLTLNRCADALAARAARWFGLYPRKGTLLPGSDADLAVWDLSARTEIRSEGLSMGSDWTPYEGFTALAEPELVLVRGTPVVADGRECAPPGHGNFLQREPSALASAQPPEAVASASRS